MSDNISLNKVSNNKFRNFLETCTGKKILMESMLKQGS